MSINVKIISFAIIFLPVNYLTAFKLCRNSTTNNYCYEVITELNHTVSPHGYVPPHIKYPPYAETGVVPVCPSSIEIKTDEQIAAMRTACITARKVLNIARDNVKVRHVELSCFYGTTFFDLAFIKYGKITFNCTQRK